MKSNLAIIKSQINQLACRELPFIIWPICYVQVELRKKCTTLQSIVKQISLLINELMSVCVHEAQIWGDLKSVKLNQLLELAKECSTLQSSVTMQVHELMCVYVRVASYLDYLSRGNLMEVLVELARECSTLQSSLTLLVRELRSVYVKEARSLGYLESLKLREELFEFDIKKYTALQSLIKSVTLLVNKLRSMYVQEARCLGYSKHIKLMEQLLELARECTTLQSSVTLLVCKLICVCVRITEAQYWGYPIQTELLAKVCTTLQSSIKSGTMLVNELRSIYVQEARCLGSLKCVKLMEQLLELARECSTMQSSFTLLVCELMSVHVEKLAVSDLKILTLMEQLLPLFKECSSLQSSVTLLVNELKSVYVQEARCLGYSKYVKLVEQLVELTRECTTVQSSTFLLVCELMYAYVEEDQLVIAQKSVESMEHLLVLVKECSTLQSSVTLLVNKLSSMHVQEAQFCGYSRQTEQLVKEYTALRSFINLVTMQDEELMIQEPQSRLVKCMEQLRELVKECITLLYPHFQSERILENVLDKTHLHQDLTLVEQTMNYTALQPLFLTDTLLFSLSNTNYLTCTGPQLVVLNINWKLDTCNSTTILSSNFKSEFILENVLDEPHLHQYLTSVEQTMNYTALQPLNKQPLFLTGILLFSLINNNYLTCTGPQLVILNSRKPDTCNSWPFHFGVTAFNLYVKHWFNIEGVLNRLVILCSI